MLINRYFTYLYIIIIMIYSYIATNFPNVLKYSNRISAMSASRYIIYIKLRVLSSREYRAKPETNYINM